jgi:site-specific DNA recombinase
MGRLTLNVLLSFAQFEREVTGERIRDKFAASKKKGIFMGGPLPIGYDVKDRKLIINEPEAEVVRYIYKRFMERGENETMPELLNELKSKGYKNKSWISRAGNQIVGKDFDLKQIYRILSNPVYCGKIKHKDKSLRW